MAAFEATWSCLQGLPALRSIDLPCLRMVAEYASSFHLWLHGPECYMFPESCFGAQLPELVEWQGRVIPQPQLYVSAVAAWDAPKLAEVTSLSLSNVSNGGMSLSAVFVAGPHIFLRRFHNHLLLAVSDEALSVVKDESVGFGPKDGTFIGKTTDPAPVTLVSSVASVQMF